MLKGTFERSGTSHITCTACFIKSVRVCVYMYGVMTRRMEEKLNQQEVDWQQVQGSLNRRNRDIKRLSKENGWAPHQQRAEEKTKGAEMEETGNGYVRGRRTVLSAVMLMNLLFVYQFCSVIPQQEQRKPLHVSTECD